MIVPKSTDERLQELERETKYVRAMLDALSDKDDLLLRMTSHVLRELANMGKVHDAIKAGLAGNDAKLSTLFALRETARTEDESALSDLQDAVVAQGKRIDDEITAEKASASDQSAPVTATVSAATTAGTQSIPISSGDASAVSSALGAAVTSGATLAVSGPGIAAGTTLDGVASSTLTLSQPTVADHAGDGSEALTMTPVAKPDGAGSGSTSQVVGDVSGTVAVDQSGNGAISGTVTGATIAPSAPAAPAGVTLDAAGNTVPAGT